MWQFTGRISFKCLHYHSVASLKLYWHQFPCPITVFDVEEKVFKKRHIDGIVESL